MSAPRAGVSFVVPVKNGARWLDMVLEAILAQADGRPMEILVVDDQSTDESARIVERHVGARPVVALHGPGRGAAAAVNLGVRHARHPIICQVDQDVVVGPGWMARLVEALETPDVAAAQGYYATPDRSTLWARAMGLDLELRYTRLRGHHVDHVCTGNTAYRAEALREVGFFDERLGYGYDNDMSYRLVAAGYRLVFCREARSVHHWRDTGRAYLRQQYGLAYGRFDLIRKHPRRLFGDDVSGPDMMLHVLAPLAAILGGAGAALAGPAGVSWDRLVAVPAGLLGLLAVERLWAGARAARRFRDPAALAFVPVHLLRDLAWAAALVVWLARRPLTRAGRAPRVPRPARHDVRRAPARRG